MDFENDDEEDPHVYDREHLEKVLRGVSQRPPMSRLEAVVNKWEARYTAPSEIPNDNSPSTSHAPRPSHSSPPSTPNQRNPSPSPSPSPNILPPPQPPKCPSSLKRTLDHDPSNEPARKKPLIERHDPSLNPSNALTPTPISNDSLNTSTSHSTVATGPLFTMNDYPDFPPLDSVRPADSNNDGDVVFLGASSKPSSIGRLEGWQKMLDYSVGTISRADLDKFLTDNYSSDLSYWEPTLARIEQYHIDTAVDGGVSFVPLLSELLREIGDATSMHNATASTDNHLSFEQSIPLDDVQLTKTEPLAPPLQPNKPESRSRGASPASDNEDSQVQSRQEEDDLVRLIKEHSLRSGSGVYQLKCRVSSFSNIYTAQRIY